MKNKVAVITGASSGMGLAIAQKLAIEGCMLALIARNEKKLVKAATQIKKKYKIRIETYACDVTQGEQVRNTVTKIQRDFKEIDILVNSAGGSHTTESKDLYDAAFDADMNLNLRGTHLCCRLFSTIIKKGGAIVNISSMNGQVILYPPHGKNALKMGYIAAKAGVIQLTKAYAVELADMGIRVNAVSPGPIYPTGMTQIWDKKKQKAVTEKIPLQRLGKPEDVANAVYFLASDLSSFITGHTLDVNGGRYMS